MVLQTIPIYTKAIQKEPQLTENVLNEIKHIYWTATEDILKAEESYTKLTLGEEEVTINNKEMVLPNIEVTHSQRPSQQFHMRDIKKTDIGNRADTYVPSIYFYDLDKTKTKNNHTAYLVEER